MEQTLLLIPLTLLFAVLLHLVSDFSKKKLKRMPPGPTPLPIVGNLFDVAGLPHHSFAKLAKTYGSVMCLKMGFKTFVILTTPETAREAFQKKDKALSYRWLPDHVRPHGHNEISMVFLPSSNPLWKHIRTYCTTYLFSTRSLENTRAVREVKARELVTYFRNHAGVPVTISSAVFSTFLNILSNVLFSEDVVDLGSDTKQEFRALVVASIKDPGAPNISDLFPFLRALDLQGRRQSSAKRFQQFYDFFDGVINRRLNRLTTHGEEHKDFLDSLLELQSENKIDRRKIRTLLTDIFLAGAHTSSVAVEWAMAELLHNTNKMSKVSSELRQEIGSKQVEEADLTKLLYLQAVLKETLRLHPIAPLLLPHKTEDPGVELGGYKIPKGAEIMVNMWAIGRDPSVWDEPDVFKPERFLENEIDFRGHDFQFIPFGSGRRACPGLPLAARTLPLILATLLHAFNWELPNGMKPSDMNMSEKFEAAAALAAPLQAVPMPL